MISENRKVYYNYGSNEFMLVPYNINMLTQFTEFVDILQGNLNYQDATNFNTYSNAASYPSLPKYILYSGHNDSISALIRTFDNEKYKFVNSPPASSVQIEFTEIDEELKINIYYNPNPETFDNREAIFIDGIP